MTPAMVQPELQLLLCCCSCLCTGVQLALHEIWVCQVATAQSDLAWESLFCWNLQVYLTAALRSMQQVSCSIMIHIRSWQQREHNVHRYRA